MTDILKQPSTQFTILAPVCIAEEQFTPCAGLDYSAGMSHDLFLVYYWADPGFPDQLDVKQELTDLI